MTQGCPKRNPGLELANAFSVVKAAELMAEPAIDFNSGSVLHTLPQQGPKTPSRLGDWCQACDFAILCRSPVVLLNDLGASALESQNRKPAQ